MKIISQNLLTSLPQAKLFLDDLQEIDKILTESWPSSSYTLIIDEYELNSINEITQIVGKEDFNKLEIRMSQANFNLILNGRIIFSSYISSSRDSICIGTIEKIKPIIQKRRPKYNYFIFLVIFMFLLMFINYLDKNYYNLYSGLIEGIVLVTAFLLSVAILIFIIRDFYVSNKRKGVIVFTTKTSTQQTNYFRRNKDQLITILISGVISGIIGIVVGLSLAWFRFKLTGKCSP